MLRTRWCASSPRLPRRVVACRPRALPAGALQWHGLLRPAAQCHCSCSMCSRLPFVQDLRQCKHFCCDCSVAHTPGLYMRNACITNWHVMWC